MREARLELEHLSEKILDETKYSNLSFTWLFSMICFLFCNCMIFLISSLLRFDYLCYSSLEKNYLRCYSLNEFFLLFFIQSAFSFNFFDNLSNSSAQSLKRVSLNQLWKAIRQRPIALGIFTFFLNLQYVFSPKDFICYFILFFILLAFVSFFQVLTPFLSRIFLLARISETSILSSFDIAINSSSYYFSPICYNQKDGFSSSDPLLYSPSLD